MHSNPSWLIISLRRRGSVIYFIILITCQIVVSHLHHLSSSGFLTKSLTQSTGLYCFPICLGLSSDTSSWICGCSGWNGNILHSTSQWLTDKEGWAYLLQRVNICPTGISTLKPVLPLQNKMNVLVFKPCKKFSLRNSERKEANILNFKTISFSIELSMHKY